jgi:hypothetical protein
MDLRNHGAEPKFKIIANIAGIGSGGCALCLIRYHMLSLSKSFDSAAAQVSEKRNTQLFGGGVMEVPTHQWKSDGGWELES